MSLADYLNELQATKTYQEGVIKTQEYSFKSRWGGLLRSLPPVPQANEDRHVVVIELRGNQPHIFTILKEPNHSISPTTRDADKLLFIFIEMKPRMLQIDAPPEGYTLGDGHHIRAKFELTYQVVDAKEFWQGSTDPLATLEKAVINEARDYFLGITSRYLIREQADLKKTVEQHIQETGVKVIKSKLENDISKECVIPGIKLTRTYAQVYLSDTLSAYLKELHDQMYGESGKKRLGRQYIERMIDDDSTFAPYGLRQIIMALDTGLLENFHTMEWSAAMRKVHERLAEEKRKYMEAQENAERSRLKRLIATAQEVGLDEMDIEDLKGKLADKLLQSVDEKNSQMPTNNEFLQQIIDPTSAAGQLSASEQRKLSDQTDSNESSE